MFRNFIKCLGSGSVGSARFWVPGSGTGSTKICGSTDPDPTKSCKKKTTLKTQILTIEKRDLKNFPISEWESDKI